jgi:hypothetical protein
MQNYQYNEYYGNETLNKEYKLFTLHPKGILIDPNDDTYAENLLKTGKWVFNKSVLDNLDFYLNTYIPKYTTAFLNDISETNYGEMYFGISDDGIIQGIPYQGELNKEVLESKVRSILQSDLINCSNSLVDYVKTEIINIDITDFKFQPSHNKIINTYLSEKKIYNNKFKKYIANKKKWLDMIDHYNNKLNNLLNNNNTRHELINYLLVKSPEQKELIRILKSEYKFPIKTGEEITQLKKNKKSIWYWLTRWKDDMTDFVKTIKPYPPHGLTNGIYPLNIITTVIDMIPHWLKNNNINMYLIKFTFTKPSIKLKITYKGHYDEYTHCYRSIVGDQPCCLPY